MKVRAKARFRFATSFSLIARDPFGVQDSSFRLIC